MPTYTCDKCARTFKQKSGFDDHKAKKIDCSQNTVLNTVIESKVKEVVKSLLPKKALELPSDPIKRDAILQDYFKRLHDILWDRAGFNPEKAMEHLIFFFAYRLIEKQAEALSLPQECRWSFLSSKTNENDRYEIMKKGCIAFQKNPTTKPFFKKPEIDKVDIVFDIIEHINMIPDEAIDNTDTLGNIFEYMQSWGWATMGTNGQYFTNRSICRLAFTLAYRIKGTLKRPDGSLCTFADWFCGTGGFPAEYIKGVNTHLPTIDWKTQNKSICCQDQSVSSVATTLLNLLIMTGHPFTERVKQGNSFSDPITTRTAPFAGYAIDYLFLNPPYAGSAFVYSKSVKDEAGNKTKKFYVNQEIQSIGIEDDVKVSAGVQLAMATLSHEGVCCIVLPQGFFFGSGKKNIELRKKIAEEYNILYIVDIASGSFLNTGTKTSMMVFQKGVGPTEKVAFIGLDEKPLVEATLEELRSKHYSFNYKQYMAQTAIEVDGFRSLALSEICEFKRGTMITKANIVDGVNPVIGGGLSPIGYHTAFNRPANTILISQSGTAGHISRYNVPVWASDCFSVESKTEELLDSYLYHILKSIEPDIKALKKGTAQPHVYPSTIEHLMIAVPSLERQHEIVKAIDGWADLAQREETALMHLEEQVKFQVKDLAKGKDYIPLDQVCNVNSGQTFRKEDIVPGDIPVIGGGKIVGYHNASNRPGNEFSITRVGDCTLNWFYSPYMLTEHGFSITLKNTESSCLLKTIYYHFINSKEDLELQYDGTAQKLITKTKLREFTIPSFDTNEIKGLQADFDEIQHKSGKIASYKARAQSAITRLIPGLAPELAPEIAPVKIPFKINKRSS